MRTQSYAGTIGDGAHMHLPANIQSNTAPYFGASYQGNVFPFHGSHPIQQAPVSHSPVFNYHHPHDMGYAMPPPGMHAVLPNIGIPPGPPQFAAASQSWPRGMPLQYEGMPSHPSQGVHGGWPMGGGFQEQYMMRPPPSSSHDSVGGRRSATPTPSWTTEGEAPQSLESRASSHSVPARQVATPSPASGRPPSRGKNPRKGPVKKWVSSRAQQAKSAASSSSEISGTPTFGRKAQSIKGGKKKWKDRSTPVPGERPSSTASDDRTVDSAAVATDDPAARQRADLAETPAVRSAFKEFYRNFRAQEKVSLRGAESFALRSLEDGSVPESVHWRVYIEIADLAKRANEFQAARKLYQKACQLQPYASQVWLEYSKLEEECGNMSTCTKILATGLEYCEYNENLLSRAIKHEEKLGNLSRARELLARLKHVGIEKVWRSVLEGALMEARAGNDAMARRVLKYLMHHVPWYGPLYLEAFKLERDLGRSEEALAIVEKGLGSIPRYGPLWFGAFRLCEEIDVKEESYHLPRSTGMIERATLSISKELLWKVHLEAAQMLERSSTEYMNPTDDSSEIIDRCRKRFAMTIVTCPPSLRWKVWLAAGRMEVAAGNSETARRLFLNAHKVVPDKGRAVALLECARLEEFVGDVELASAILCKGRLLGGSDWKVWLESVMLSIRSGDYQRAIVLSQQALQQHSGTGRLWASLIQLRHFSEGERAQFRTLGLALNAVPKSGEVWCEGARIHLNPFSQTFDLQRASRHLFFATKFTPQYGDGFLESLRLLIVFQLLLPIAALIWEETKEELVGESDQEWNESVVKYLFKYICEIYRIRDDLSRSDDSVKETDENHFDSFLGDSIATALKERVYSDKVVHFLDISRLELRCSNADPNYGPMWFYCRSRLTDTARVVLGRAVNIILDDVKFHANVYIAALVRRFAITSRFELKVHGEVTEGTSTWEKMIDKECFSVPSLQHIFETGSDISEAGVEFLESSTPPSDFITGIVALSRHRPVEKMTSDERRKMLFGADSIFS
jgi:la-related protein 1